MKNKINLPKLLILGNARHGKDTFAEILNEKFGYTFQSSSQAAADIFIYDELKDKYGYETSVECFEDRVNHRTEWYNMICDYNKDDKARLAKKILEKSDCYVGMRDLDEINACMEQGLFDVIIWVDASKRLPLEDGGSFNIDISCADVVMFNNDTLEAFEEKVVRFGSVISGMKPMEWIDFKGEVFNSNMISFYKRYAIYGDNEVLCFEDFKARCFIDGWPNINGEPLDLENNGILSLSEESLVVNCGGDWQNPHKVIVKVGDLGLYVESYKECNYDDGLSEEEILDILGVPSKIVK